MKRYAIAGLVLLLAAIGWIGVNSNAWQTYLIKRDLRSYGARLNDNETLSVIARAFAYAGDSQLALQLVDRIKNARAKVDALIRIAEFYAELGDKERASALFSDAIKATERIGSASDKFHTLRSIAMSFVSRGEKEKAKSLLSDAIRVAERIDDNQDKAYALETIALSVYDPSGEIMKDGVLLTEVVKAADQIGRSSQSPRVEYDFPSLRISRREDERHRLAEGGA